MKEIKIMKCQIDEAMEQIDTIKELGLKERGCLRLLTEEMFSMCRELLDVLAMDFEIKEDGKQYTLFGAIKTTVNETAREQFLSVSSDGKNAANKGAKGVLGAVLEMFSLERDPSYYNAALALGMHSPDEHFGYSYMWTLSRYMEDLEATKDQPKWDGLEKSIIANFADDVSIGVRSGRVEMTISKNFNSGGKRI